MRNIKLTIEYDGKDFNGWQKQPTKLNIQGTIEQAIKSITGEENIELNASGRTDAGVHAPYPQGARPGECIRRGTACPHRLEQPVRGVFPHL